MLLSIFSAVYILLLSAFTFSSVMQLFLFFNPIALRKAKIAYNFGLSECNRVNNRGFNNSRMNYMI